MSDNRQLLVLVLAVASLGCVEIAPPSTLGLNESEVSADPSTLRVEERDDTSVLRGSDAPPPSTRRELVLSSADEGERDARRALRLGSGVVQARTSLADTLDGRGSELVELTVTFPDRDIPSLDGVARLPLLERAERIARREAASAESLDQFRAEARALGATSASTIWLTNSLQVRMPAARAAEFLRNHPDANASLNGQLAAEWSGRQVRLQTGGDRLVTAGFHGDPPGSARYRIGLIEIQNDGPNWPARTHPAFRESSSDPTSRISVVEDCNACTQEFLGICFEWGCRSVNPTGPTTGHGDVVAWVAAGSIEQGQDPAVVDPNARQFRSGIAPEPLLDYYGVNDCDAVSRALQRAVARGVDVVNMSFRADFTAGPTSSCDAAMNCGGINEAIRAATDAGVVVVKSAGNLGQSDPNCGLTYPAWRPEVISVGGLFTQGTTGTLASVPLADSSSRGGVGVRYAGMGTDDTASGIGVVAPQNVECFLDATAASGWNCISTRSGTSFAAPAVAGLATMFAHSLSAAGSIANARDVIANVLLMGDLGPTFGLTHTHGFGRVRAFAPNSTVLAAPWGWGTHRLTGGVGTTVFTVWDAGPESPSVREWRWVAASFENDLRNLQTDYIIRVVDACPPGGGRVTVMSDQSFDPRKRIELSQASICPPGRPTCRCLEMEVVVFQAPASGVRIHMADYFHGGDPNVF